MLEYTKQEKYSYIKATDDVKPDCLIDLYEGVFQKLEGYKQVFFLIDARVQPSLLCVDSYARILGTADRYNIGHIEMALVSEDNARQIIGTMVEELSANFKVSVNVSFFSTTREAQQVLESLVQAAEYLES